MKRNREYRDFEQELKKQEKAFDEPSKRGIPHRFYVSAKAMARIWLAVAALLLVCTLVFVVYELIHREGLWLVMLIFAGATLISVANWREYLRKDREAALAAEIEAAEIESAEENPALPENAEN